MSSCLLRGRAVLHRLGKTHVGYLAIFVEHLQLWYVYVYICHKPSDQWCVAESPALASLLTVTRGAEAVCMWEGQGITKEPLLTTHDTEGGRSYTCREKSEIGSFLEVFRHQRVLLGICVRRSWRVIFENQNHLAEKCGENNMEKHQCKKLY